MSLVVKPIGQRSRDIIGRLSVRREIRIHRRDSLSLSQEFKITGTLKIP